MDKLVFEHDEPMQTMSRVSQAQTGFLVDDILVYKDAQPGLIINVCVKATQ